MKARTGFGLWLVTSVCLLGCGRKPYGASAPAYGSSTQFASTAGFLVGNWELQFDNSKNPSASKFLEATLPNEYLKFKADHACEFSTLGHTVHMTWHEVGDGITLQPVDVDGYDLQTVRAPISRQSDGLQGNSRTAWRERETALDLAEQNKRLTLMPDKKRLYDPDEQTPHIAYEPISLGQTWWVRTN